MRYGAIAGLVFLGVSISGCASVIEKTNFLSDDDVLEESAAALGYKAAQLTLTSRETKITNTYVSLTANDGKEFHCIINGGNLLTLGIVNPPMCAPKGETIKTPFSR